MVIAVSSDGPTMESPACPRFGRAPSFLIVDTDTGKHTCLANSSAMESGGAGIQTAQMLAAQGVNAVVTGNVGPNAVRALQAAGVRIYLSPGGSVKEVTDLYTQGKLTEVQGPSVPSHSGLGWRRI